MGKNKLSKIWYYIVFLLGFVCCGFVFNAESVSAAGPSIFIPDDSKFVYSNGITFYVGYDVLTVNSVKYKFDEGSWVTISSPDSNYNKIYKDKSAESLCKSVGISSCASIIIEYKVSNLIVPVSNNTFNGTNVGTFTFSVEASNKKWPLGGTNSASRVLTYDAQGPTVEKVSISRSDSSKNTYFKIGDTIKFTVFFMEYGWVDEGLKLSFKINDSSKEAICASQKGNAITSTVCEYVVAEDDSGVISDLKLINANKIKDVYNNHIPSDIEISVVKNDNGLSVDGVKATISSVSAETGMFSGAKAVNVQVTFSENVSGSSASDAPVLKVKFGEGIDRTCSFISGETNNLVYRCEASADDQGKMKFVSMTGGKYFDVAGNSLSLEKEEITFDNTEINNNIPTLNTVTLSTVGCSLESGKTYCKKDDTIKFVFSFNLDIEEFTSKSINLLFNGVKGVNSYSLSYDETEKTLQLVYIVGTSDNGKLSLNYSFELLGKNGLANSISNTREYDYFVDNTDPVLGNMQISFNGIVFDNGVVYSAPGGELEFSFNVSDDSKISLDSSKIYLVDESNNKLDVCADCDITNLVASLNDNVLTIKVSVANKEFIKNVKVMIEKDDLDLAIAAHWGVLYWLLILKHRSLILKLIILVIKVIMMVISGS